MPYEVAFAGLLLSLLFVTLTGYYPGGIIVPSYLVLFAGEPERVVGTLIAAGLALLTYRLASRWLILFGQRRFVFLLLAGACWSMVWLLALPELFPVALEFRVIGWVVPGLIANHFERQGVLVTSAALITVTALLYYSGRLLGALGG